MSVLVNKTRAKMWTHVLAIGCQHCLLASKLLGVFFSSFVNEQSFRQWLWRIQGMGQTGFVPSRLCCHFGLLGRVRCCEQKPFYVIWFQNQRTVWHFFHVALYIYAMLLDATGTSWHIYICYVVGCRVSSKIWARVMGHILFSDVNCLVQPCDCKLWNLYLASY